ncbi:MAG: putative lipid II flippase FtsW [Francisellaceae bacterium]|jgi:cell division protein FtsW|nr:putative lipid II flippase FtsW [Francisellaceae bacterium]MBT6207468.1 putative lipid II flippase FtsW [Francisellaceae bacterium]MBT6539230.1 putative lipid II flippase FtsW [Francisellaceae bacterium]
MVHNHRPKAFEHILFICVITLLALGLVMVTSASIPITQRYLVPPLYFAINQFTYAILGLSLMIGVSFIPMQLLYRFSGMFLFVSIVLLILVLIPGVAKTVNGSSRWLILGPISVQASEIVKLGSIIYLGGYLYRRADNLNNNLLSFFIPLFFLVVLSVLLLLEPDFGATVVLGAIFMGMLLIAGVPWSRFLLLFPVIISAFGSLIYFSPYRMQRLLSFVNPWENQFDSGYQLVQSLIAIGRGGLWGNGLGGSIQKLFYLPEPHTDFIFAVLAEELGMFGALGLIALFAILFFRIYKVASAAANNKDFFSSYITVGILIWLVAQTFINIAVNMGMLPTKGISLPFISFGGSNLLVNCIAIGVVLRVNFETRMKMLGD